MLARAMCAAGALDCFYRALYLHVCVYIKYPSMFESFFKKNKRDHTHRRERRESEQKMINCCDEKKIQISSAPSTHSKFIVIVHPCWMLRARESSGRARKIIESLSVAFQFHSSLLLLKGVKFPSSHTHGRCKLCASE